jgi:hypothetical protein
MRSKNLRTTTCILLCLLTGGGCTLSPHGGLRCVPFAMLPETVQEAMLRPLTWGNEGREGPPHWSLEKAERSVYQQVVPEESFDEFRSKLEHFYETMGKKPCQVIKLRTGSGRSQTIRTFYFDPAGNPIQP